MNDKNIIAYIRKSDWILDHVSHLNLNSVETVILLLLDLSIRKKEHVDPKILANKANIGIKEFDEGLTKLIQKGYVKVDITQDEVHYQLDDSLFIFSTSIESSSQKDILGVFEREFKRPLSNHEIDKLNDWLMKLDYGFLMHALREAVIYKKLNFNYIDRILVKWLDEKTTLDDLDKGLHK